MKGFESINCPHKVKNTPWIAFRNSCYAFSVTKDRWKGMRSDDIHHLCRKMSKQFFYSLYINIIFDKAFGIENTCEPFLFCACDHRYILTYSCFGIVSMSKATYGDSWQTVSQPRFFKGHNQGNECSSSFFRSVTLNVSVHLCVPCT